MNILETYGDFVEHNNSKIWIVGVPSGEALQVTRQQIDDLFQVNLLYYSTKYVSTGFYVFKDKNISTIKDIIKYNKTPKIKTKNKELLIYNNNYDRTLLNAIEQLVEEYVRQIELYVQDDTIGITYNKLYYIEINMSPDNDGFKLTQYHKGNIIDEYYVFTPERLLVSLQHALYDYE